MSTLSFDRRLVLPRPGRTLARAALGTVPALALILMWTRHGRMASVALILVVFTVAQIAIATVTGHKEIMAATLSFFRPGLRRQLWFAQLAWALTAGLAAAIVAMAGLPHPGWREVTTMLFLAIAIYAGTAFLAFRLWWSFLGPYLLFNLFAWSRVVKRLDGDGTLAVWLAQPWPWLLAAVCLLALLGREVLSAPRHRRLNGTVVLGPEDILRPWRLPERSVRCTGDQRLGPDLRWRAPLLNALLARAADARRRNREIATQAWLLAHSGVSEIVSVRTRASVGLAISFAGMMLCGGYFDAWRPDSGLHGWFAGLAYSFAALPMAGIFQAMSRTRLVPASRRVGLRAELVTMAAAIATTAGLALIMGSLYLVLETVLPPLSWGGRNIAFSAPAPHGMWLTPLLAPFIWLAVALRPRLSAQLANLVSVQTFLLGHALLTLVPYTASVPIFVSLATLAGVAACVRRRRWWRRADLAV